MINKTGHIIISIVFLMIIVGTFVLHESGLVKKKPSKENRKLAEKPILTFNTLETYPLDYESYYRDHFSFKSQYMELMSKMGMVVFKKALLGGKVIRGKDDWLFEWTKNLPIYLGDKTFTDQQLEKIRIEFENRISYFDSLGIKTYGLVCPSKFSTYSEYLPFFLKHREFERTNLFIDVMNELDGIKVVDGRQSLLKRKKDHLLYQKYDTHWNRLGAFFTFYDLYKELRHDFPQLSPYTLDSFNIDTTENTKGNLLWMVGADRGYADPEYDLTYKNDSIYRMAGFEHTKTDDFPYSQWEYCRRYTASNENTDTLKVLIFHDSYAIHSNTFLPYFFNETLYIWDSWKYKFNKEIVDIEKPDIIIYWMYEGYLDRILLEPSFVEPEDLDKGLQ